MNDETDTGLTNADVTAADPTTPRTPPPDPTTPDPTNTHETSMSTATDTPDRTPPPPSDYRLAVPEGWERVVLDPDRWTHRIDRLVNRSLRRTKASPQLKAALAERMAAQAQAAHANGGVEMYLFNQLLGQVPVSAGLVVTVMRPPAGTAAGDLGDIALSLTARAATGDEVTTVELPAGPAVRHLYRRRPAPDDPDGNKLLVTHLDVYLAVPHADQRLLLSFSTPMEPLAEALVGLFDSVARTLQWMA